MIDLLVIGAGLSGLMAASSAAQAGLSVRVIAKGMGALHWGAGTVDLLGYLPGASQPLPRPLETIQTLTAENPGHPYALLQKDELADALASFVNLTDAMGLPYRGGAEPGHNLLLPSPVGAARPAYLAPRAQIAGDLGRAEPLLIVGFQGLRDFYPAWIAENLAKLGYPARAAFLPLTLITERRDANTVQLAHQLDDPARAEKLADALAGLARPGERIGLPAILGMDRHAEVMAALQKQANAPIFEIPTLPPSVPGLRLFKAIRTQLERLGVRVQAGMEVVGFETDGGGVIRWVETATSARPFKHRARDFLLATGGILGGGIDSDHGGRVWETIFDLPVTTPQQRSQWFQPRFLDPTGHPVFRGGVPVNGAFRPVDDAGRPVFDNLRVAGNLLAGADPIWERSREGIAITTGMAAARRIIARRHPA